MATSSGRLLPRDSRAERNPGRTACWLPAAACWFALCSAQAEEPEGEVPQPPSPQALASYALYCAPCHGQDGEGKKEFQSPSIAGLPSWYILAQMEKFRLGHRGGDATDTLGVQMRAVAFSVSQEALEEAAQAAASFPPRLTEPPAEDAPLDEGRYLYANHCMACHRYNGKGDAAFHSASLVYLNRDYLTRQLLAYQSGERGQHPDDMHGKKMADAMTRFHQEEINRLVDYIGALAHGDDPRSARER